MLTDRGVTAGSSNLVAQSCARHRFWSTVSGTSEYVSGFARRQISGLVDRDRTARQTYRFKALAFQFFRDVVEALQAGVRSDISGSTVLGLRPSRRFQRPCLKQNPLVGHVLVYEQAFVVGGH
jgi:hypothetical protein